MDLAGGRYGRLTVIKELINNGKTTGEHGFR